MKKTELKTYETKQVIEIICDICGSIGRFGDWAHDDIYGVATTQVSFRSGSDYGSDGGMGTTVFADICPDCFMKKLKPALEAIGCKFQLEEWSTY